MDVVPSRSDSYERLMYDAGPPSFLLDLREGYMKEGLRQQLLKQKLEHFIGVIYRPDTECSSHYAEAVLPERAVRRLRLVRPKSSGARF